MFMSAVIKCLSVNDVISHVKLTPTSRSTRAHLVFKLLFIHLLCCFPQPSEEVKAAAQTLYIQKYARTHTHTHTHTHTSKMVCVCVCVCVCVRDNSSVCTHDTS